MTTSNQPNIQITYPQNIPDSNPQSIQKYEMVNEDTDSSGIQDKSKKEPFDLDKRGVTFVKDRK